MEPEIHPPAAGQELEVPRREDEPADDTPAITEDAAKSRDLGWAFIGSRGLRAGWSVLIFSILTFVFYIALEIVNATIHPVDMEQFTVRSAFLEKLMESAAVAGAALLIARMEQRRFTDFNLAGPRRILHFLGGVTAGFLAVSFLVGSMAWGGWLHIDAPSHAGTHIFILGAAWSVAFLMTGLAEEGAFRCYLQFTLTRGINFWWALGIVATLCLRLMMVSRGNGAAGVYLMGLLGVAPCLLLQLKKTPGRGFWQAAWVTSTAFGYWHTGNNGENWIGILAAAAIGFVFCVSIRVTGSAWWAIGCHTAWDWAETFFYGTADSGLPARGHYLTAAPAGNVLWSGGDVGPEGSLLVLGVILLLLAALIVICGHRKAAELPAQAAEQAAG